MSLPFLPLSRLTTEWVVAENERFIQSNHEFHLIDGVKINLIHLQMPYGGTGTKRSETNLEKHLAIKDQLFVFKTKMKYA